MPKKKKKKKVKKVKVKKAKVKIDKKKSKEKVAPQFKKSAFPLEEKVEIKKIKKICWKGNIYDDLWRRII